MFMPLPAISLMQSARHVTSYVHIHLGSQNMNTILMTPAVKNIDAKAFQHTGTLYIFGFSMKMDVSTALQLILSKMVNTCLMSQQIAPPLND
jgi:hypothetical protein